MPESALLIDRVLAEYTNRARWLPIYKRELAKILAEDRRPQIGPYYWIPTPEGWEILPFFGDDLDHFQIWPRVCRVLGTTRAIGAYTGLPARAGSKTCSRRRVNTGRMW